MAVLLLALQGFLTVRNPDGTSHKVIENLSKPTALRKELEGDSLMRSSLIRVHLRLDCIICLQLHLHKRTHCMQRGESPFLFYFGSDCLLLCGQFEQFDRRINVADHVLPSDAHFNVFYCRNVVHFVHRSNHRKLHGRLLCDFDGKSRRV